MRIAHIFKVVGKQLSDNSPSILTALGVVGVVSTTVLAVRATPEAVRRLDAASEENWKTLTPVEVVKTVGTLYIPAAAVGISTIACIVGSNSINLKRQAAIMSLYSLTDAAFTEYKDKVVQVVGEKKEQNIRDEIAKDRMDRDPVENKEVLLVGNGDVLVYDTLTGRYFESSVEKLNAAKNTINARIITDMYASQNDFYREIGLPTIQYGDEVGWRTDNMLDFTFSTHLTASDRPALSMDFRLEPIKGYYKFG